MFFRLQHILYVKEPLSDDNSVANVHFDKYKNIKLSNLEKESIAEKIKIHLIDSKSFLESKYSLHDLSVELNLPQHTVSMVINSTMGTTFHDLINKYRFDEALLILNASSHPKIEAIAYDCGFGNRTSFYKVFKKYTGTTPAHYENSNTLKKL
jgi:AraC-like DNA-binding protein